jgi:hypothetical protein
VAARVCTNDMHCSLEGNNGGGGGGRRKRRTHNEAICSNAEHWFPVNANCSLECIFTESLKSPIGRKYIEWLDTYRIMLWMICDWGWRLTTVSTNVIKGKKAKLSLRLITYQAMNTYGGMEVQIYHSWPHNYMEASGQLHASAAFFP